MPIDYTQYLNANQVNPTFSRAGDPNRQVRQMGEDLQAVQAYLPYLTQYVDNAALQSMTRMTDPTNRLALEQYQQYAPQFNAVGNQITAQNVAAEADLMNKYGPQLMNALTSMQQQVDPEYYKMRGETAGNLSRLMSSIDPSGALTPTERDELDKMLLRQNQQAGTSYSPSQTNITSNAMQYGKEGANRQAQKQGALTNAIMASNSFLPQSRTTDTATTYGIATGKGTNNPGMGQYQGIQSGRQQAAGLGSQLQQQPAGYRQGNLASDEFEDKKWRQNWNMGSQMLGSFIGGVAGACWVAREVYGEDNIKWLIYRNWLFTKAPTWFKNLYIKHGSSFADYIMDKPLVKSLIRKWMDYVIQ